MNINFLQSDDTVNTQADIDDHIASMTTAGYPIAEDRGHALLPEGPEYPGSYQIWLKVVGVRTGIVGWIYVDPEGVVQHRSNLTGDNL